MLKNPSLTTRIAIGKLSGFVLGLGGFIYLTQYMPESSDMLRWGVLLWYATIGAVIGAFGVYTQHPVLKLPMPWWFMGSVVGAWMNFVLTLFAFDVLQDTMIAVLGEGSYFQSPFWFVLEGAIVGVMIGYFCKRFGGEGKAAVDGDLE